MKRFNFVFVSLCCLMLSSSLSAQIPYSRITKEINAAWKAWDKQPIKAQKALEKAFNESVVWTNAKYLDSVREKGFYLASLCLCPELTAEVDLICDTYLYLFPKGRHRKQILIRKAFIDFSVGDSAAGNRALALAEKSSKRSTYKEKTLRFSGLLRSGNYRTAEKYIESSYLKNKNRKLKKDLRRFHAGNAFIKNLVKKVRDGKLRTDKAISLLEAGTDSAAFAKQAPEAQLLAIKLKDNARYSYNSRESKWCGLSRVVCHSTSPQLRLKEFSDFVQKYPEAAPDKKYYALEQLRNIYLYEFKDKARAENFLNEMKNVKGFKNQALAEELICSIFPDSIMTTEENKKLRKLYELDSVFPYDNGYFPVIKKEYVEFMLAISDMAQNKTSNLKKLPTFAGYAGLPLEFFYNAAIGQKDKAWEIYSGFKSTLSAKDVRLFEDVIFPLYLPAEEGDRLFLAGLAAYRNFPYISMKLIRKALECKPRVRKNEHALGVLANLYRSHMAYNEAQQVWSQLRKLHPQSIWLR